MPALLDSNELATFLAKGLVLLVLGVTVACGGDIPLPQPAKPMPHRESDDWIKPGLIQSSLSRCGLGFAGCGSGMSPPHATVTPKTSSTKPLARNVASSLESRSAGISDPD